ncbi:alpha/beta hydrolase, partial [Patescibacteria group bacterium]|nr:alpha/beta hydrolase [Patescibacteria group bacterium]MBU1967291.1 alpha/beta hydrolase [Patescibacteria group bacterium]
NNKKIILIGHSLGGKIAALYSATYPNQIKKLFLISPSGIPDELSLCKKIQKKVFSMIPHIAKQIMPQKLKNKLLERTGASADYLNASPSQKTILNNIIQENITQFLHKISAPTFLFWGILDQETPYKNHQIFLENIANAELIKFNTGHFPYVENEIEFKKELIKRI